MKSPKHISIPSPCNVSKDILVQTELGKYCSICENEVIDFTKFNDEDFILFFKNRKGKVCGSVTQRQLQIPIAYKVDRFHFSKLAKYLITAIITSFGVPVKQLYAQNLVRDNAI